MANKQNEMRPAQLVDAEILSHFITHEIDADQEFFASLFAEFKKTILAFESISFSGDADNVKNLGVQAHKQKVSCRSFGAVYIGGKFEDLEKAALASDSSRVQKFFSEIKKDIPTTLASVEKVAIEVFKTRVKNA